MSSNIFKLYRATMSLTPHALLSKTAREQCITKLKDVPMFVKDKKYKNNAAVLVPLCVVDNEVCLLFTLRALTLSSHKGQVSFPGGKMDQGESVYDTALRETEEEIGISSKDIEIWTTMSKVQGRDSDMVITPVVGVLKDFDMAKVRPNEREVAEVFTVPLKEFCNKESHASIVHDDFNIPVYDCGKHRIWGITGLITNLFLQCILPEDIYEANFLKKVYLVEELLNSKL